jgi:hypothetical protein
LAEADQGVAVSAGAPAAVVDREAAGAEVDAREAEDGRAVGNPEDARVDGITTRVTLASRENRAGKFPEVPTARKAFPYLQLRFG